MKLIGYSVHSGKENMQIDSDLLDNAILTKTTEPVFRLYGWSPKCVSLGRNQKGGKYNQAEMRGLYPGSEKGGKFNQAELLGLYPRSECIIGEIDCVRRVTGGRALLHDDEVTYSCIMPVSIIPNGESVNESYKYISGILIDFFKTLGVDLDFGENKKISTHFDYCMLISTGADVCYQGKKLIGSAQFRKEGYILQHGSILFGYDKDLLENLFHEEIKGITTVKEILPNISKEVFVRELEHYVSQL